MTNIRAWFPYRKDFSGTEVFAFAHAGAGSMVFNPLRDSLDGSGVALVPAVLPGRERRLRQRPHERMDDLLAEFEAMSRDDGFAAFQGDYAMLGHCSGALIAYEIARILERSPCRPPRLLVVASCLPPPMIVDTGTSRLTTTELFAQASELGGTPADLLGNQEFREIIERPLRADWTLIDNYVHRPRPGLSIPVLALRGQNDPDLTTPDLARWQDETSARCDVATLPLGHWLLTPAGSSELARWLTSALDGPASAGPGRGALGSSVGPFGDRRR
jgi:surfactin synthase thioesterase subunit